MHFLQWSGCPFHHLQSHFYMQNSSEGQMVQPWRTWTVKFQKVEMVPRVAKLHLAWYWEACVVSRPHPFLMASFRTTGAQIDAQWWLARSNSLVPTECQIEEIVIINLYIYKKKAFIYQRQLNCSLHNCSFKCPITLHTIQVGRICVMRIHNYCYGSPQLCLCEE